MPIVSPYIFIYLLLAHLLADFAFQPQVLVDWKVKSWKGVFVHSLIHFVTMMVLFWPMIAFTDLGATFVIFLIAFFHFFIDTKKIKKEKTTHRFMQTFFIDQIFHICVLIAATMILVPLLTSNLAYVSLLQFFVKFLPIALYFITVILSTYVYDIVLFQLTRQKHGGTAINFNYKRMFVTMLFLSLIFAVLVFFFGFQIAKTSGLPF